MDKKGPFSSADIADEERLTFGQQSPYATSSAPSEIGDDHPRSQGGNPIQSVNPSAPGVTSPSAAPPTYEEVTRNRRPAATPTRSPNNGRRRTDPSAPLLGSRPAGTSYSAAPVSSTGDDDNSPRGRRFNIIWLLLFLIVLLLLIIARYSQETGGGSDDMCAGRAEYRRRLTELNLSPRINDFTIAMKGSAGHIIVEQATTEAIAPGTAHFYVEVSASDREDFSTIHLEMQQDLFAGSLKVTVKGPESQEAPECLRAVARILFSPIRPKIENMKLTVDEGSISVDLLDVSNKAPSFPGLPTIPTIVVNQLYTRVVTGQTYVNAEVPIQATLGGSNGSIQGQILVGLDFSSKLVEGSIMLNIGMSGASKLTTSKVEVLNGTINVGMISPYEGEFKLETVSGEVTLINPDPERTHITYLGTRLIKGWSSINPQTQIIPVSNLKLSGTNANVTLSMTPLEIPQVLDD